MMRHFYPIREAVRLGKEMGRTQPSSSPEHVTSKNTNAAKPLVASQ